MSQSVETPASTGGSVLDALRLGRGRRNGGAPPGSTSAILFTELVLAHFRWFTMSAGFGEVGGVPLELAPAGWPPKHTPGDAERQTAEREYRKKLEAFTESEGEIVAAYWSTRLPSGVVMTVRRRWWPLRVVLDEPISLHRATTWLTEDQPDVAELLHHCDTLGNKAAQLLRRTPKRVAMTWIFSTESYLLGVVEQRSRRNCAAANMPPSEKPGNPPGALTRLLRAHPRRRFRRRPAKDQANGPAAPQPMPGEGASSITGDAAEAGPNGQMPALKDRDLVPRARAEVMQIELYYDRAAANAARFVYFWGMLFGAVPAAVAGFLLALAVDGLFGEAVINRSADSTRFFFACYAAGALGAIVSVLTRMRSGGSFAIDHEIGRTPAFWLGAFRPFLGAVFGILVYFALQSDLIQIETPPQGEAFFFVTLFAFAAGFSERLTQVILGGAERTVTTTLTEADNAVPGPSDQQTTSR